MKNRENLIDYNIFRTRTKFNPVAFIINRNINSYESFCNELEKKLVCPPSNEYYNKVVNHIREQEKAHVKKKPEIKEPEIKESEIKEPEIQEPEIQEPEIKESEIKEPEIKEPEIKEPEIKEPAIAEKKKRKRNKQK